MERAPRHYAASRQCRRGSRRPSLRLRVGEASACSRSDGGANKGLAARRTVRHGQTVIARCSGIQRASVHGCQGTVLKRLAVTPGAGQTGEAANTHSSTTSQQSEEQRAGGRPASSGVVLGQRAAAVVPNKGGRGIERLRLFGVPDPATARISRYLVLPQSVAGCKAVPACASRAHSII
jgi:hypothetical protein